MAPPYSEALLVQNTESSMITAHFFPLRTLHDRERAPPLIALLFSKMLFLIKTSESSLEIAPPKPSPTIPRRVNSDSLMEIEDPVSNFIPYDDLRKVTLLASSTDVSLIWKIV